MLSFLSDYTEGAHPLLLQKLSELNYASLPGYGTDECCRAAADRIRAACSAPDADVQFLVGGTQANQVVISTMLRPYEGVVCAQSGHINVHEAGAIEYSGHKVLPLPQHCGKLCAGELREYLRSFYADANHIYSTFPGMVYISHPSEFGTLYTKVELTELSGLCREYGMPLYLDGARLGYGLMSDGTDVTLADIAELCDVFYIGGTKVGALFGEAVVFTKNNTPKNFVTMTKQRGAMLAKGWLLGAQFDALFTEGLYYKIGRHAVELAMELKRVFLEKGYELYIDSPTNQQFVVMENSRAQKLRESVAFGVWEPIDAERTAFRFVTSWATRPESIAALRELL